MLSKLELPPDMKSVELGKYIFFKWEYRQKLYSIDV